MVVCAGVCARGMGLGLVQGRERLQFTPDGVASTMQHRAAFQGGSSGRLATDPQEQQQPCQALAPHSTVCLAVPEFGKASKVAVYTTAGIVLWPCVHYACSCCHCSCRCRRRAWIDVQHSMQPWPTHTMGGLRMFTHLHVESSMRR